MGWTGKRGDSRARGMLERGICSSETGGRRYSWHQLGLLLAGCDLDMPSVPSRGSTRISLANCPNGKQLPGQIAGTQRENPACAIISESDIFTSHRHGWMRAWLQYLAQRQWSSSSQPWRHLSAIMDSTFQRFSHVSSLNYSSFCLLD